MTVKPLTDNDINYPYKVSSEYDDGLDTLVVDVRRLKELFAELERFQLGRQFAAGAPDKFVRWGKVKELFGPLVAKMKTQQELLDRIEEVKTQLILRSEDSIDTADYEDELRELESQLVRK